jgi:hypothetical protein
MLKFKDKNTGIDNETIPFDLFEVLIAVYMVHCGFIAPPRGISFTRVIG